MLASQGDQVAVGDLIRAGHEIGSHHAVGTTQIVREETMARIGEQSAKHTKRVVGCHAVAEQRVRGNTRKAELKTGQVVKSETPLNHARTVR